MPERRTAAGWALPAAVALVSLALSNAAASTTPGAATLAARPTGTPETHGIVVQVTTAPTNDTAFTHDDHESLDCTTCHSAEVGHGELRFQAPLGCRSCHHDPSRYPSCEQCHEPGGPTAPVMASLRPTLRTGPAPDRPVAFEHGAHQTVACGDCHTDPGAAVPTPVDCTACHEEHHQPTSPCTGCHLPVREPEHPVTVHEGCSGAQCHQSVPDLATWSREACLVCHVPQRDHRVDDGSCATCHAVPGLGT